MSLEYLNANLVQEFEHGSQTADWWSPIFALGHGNRHASLLGVGDEEGRVTVLNGERSHQICLDDAVFDLQWSPDDEQLLLASGSGEAFVWRPRHANTAVGMGSFHTASLRCARYRPGHGAQQFATGSRDGSVALWDLRTPEGHGFNLRGIHGQAGGVRSRVTWLGWFPQQDWSLVTCGQPDYSLRVWDIRYTWGRNSTPLSAAQFDPPAGGRPRAFSHFVISPDHRLFATSTDSHIYEYWPLNASPQRAFSGEGFSTGSFYLRSDLSPDARWLASCSMDGQVHVWDTIDGYPARSLCLGPTGSAESTALSLSRQIGEPLRMAVGGEDGHLWLFHEDRQQARLQAKPNQGALYPILTRKATPLQTREELCELEDLPNLAQIKNEEPMVGRKLTEWFKRTCVIPREGRTTGISPLGLGVKRKRQSKLDQSSWWASSSTVASSIPASEL